MITEPVFYIKIVAIWIVVLSIILINVDKDKYKKHAKKVFMLFVIPVLLATFYLGIHTVNHNLHSVTKGPVHWHADFEVWACGEELNLRDPGKFIGKIGSPLFHEHNDKRIHVEGTVEDVNDVTVAAFFRVVGGDLTSTSFKWPLNGDEMAEVKNGDFCNGQPSEVKMYVNGIAVNNIETYMYYPHPLVPPGDCIIVEFGPNLPDRTDKMCDTWEVEEWNYDNFKEKRNTKNNGPVWRNENWQYIDGVGMVEVE